MQHKNAFLHFQASTEESDKSYQQICLKHRNTVKTRLSMQSGGFHERTYMGWLN